MKRLSTEPVSKDSPILIIAKWIVARVRIAISREYRSCQRHEAVTLYAVPAEFDIFLLSRPAPQAKTHGFDRSSYS
jgi:hypothetical protein